AADDPMELAEERWSHLPGLELEQARAGTDPAQQQLDGLGALERHHAAAAPDPPARGHARVIEPAREHGRLLGRDDQLQVGPPVREAQGAVRQEPPAKPGYATVLGSIRPVERRGRGEDAAGPAHLASLPGGPPRQTG